MTEYRTQAAEVSNLMAQRAEPERRVSLQAFRGPKTEWKTTEQATTILELFLSCPPIYQAESSFGDIW